MEYVNWFRDAWKQLNLDFGESFKPRTEADIQAHLYYSMLKTRGNRIGRVTIELPFYFDESRPDRIDLVVLSELVMKTLENEDYQKNVKYGKRQEASRLIPAIRLIVEIKKANAKNPEEEYTINDIRKRIEEDIEKMKLVKKIAEDARKPVELFVFRKRPRLDPEYERNTLEALRREFKNRARLFWIPYKK